MVGESGQLTQ